METTPMSYIVKLTEAEWYRHSIMDAWSRVPGYHPVFGVGLRDRPFSYYVLHEFNINIIRNQWVQSESRYVFEFESEQDYILWQLYQ